MRYVDDTQFSAMSAKAQSLYVDDALHVARRTMETRSERAGQSHGAAFLWIDVYGKNAISKAFKAALKRAGVRIIRNYRGSKFAWYLGSQQDLGVYDAFLNAARMLAAAGVHCSLCDAWD